MIFTLNNPSLEQDDAYKAIFEDLSIFSFLIFQREVGNEGTIHLQGYFEMNVRRRFETMHRKLKRVLPDDVFWLKMAKGDANSNIAYCGKEESRLPGHTTQQFGNPKVYVYSAYSYRVSFSWDESTSRTSVSEDSSVSSGSYSSIFCNIASARDPTR